jgi:hypothetical protein
MLEAHRALPVVDRVVEAALDHRVPGDVEAFPADAGALVTFHHGDVLGPRAMAEVAQHVAHLHVFGVCFGPSHADRVAPRRSTTTAWSGGLFHCPKERPSSAGTDEGLGGRDEDNTTIGVR